MTSSSSKTSVVYISSGLPMGINLKICETKSELPPIKILNSHCCMVNPLKLYILK